MASSSDQVQFLGCYQNWMTEQQQLLEELLQVHNQKPNDEQELRCIIEKLIEHFQAYIDKRAQLAIHEASSFLSPTWCTSVEKMYIWLGGCRPSVLIRFVYSLCGSQFESQLSEFLQGERSGNIGELSAEQLTLVSELQCKTIREEEILSKKLASLQENVADCPLTRLANNSDGSGSESHIGQVDQALDSHSNDLAGILMDADKMRLDTLKEIVGILTPLQAVEFLIAGKKLHLCMHRWGQRRDHLTCTQGHNEIQNMCKDG